MKQSFCRQMNCPRYCEETERQGTVVRHLCRAQDTMDTIGDWYEPVYAIGSDQCLRLRRLLKTRKEVQV